MVRRASAQHHQFQCQIHARVMTIVICQRKWRAPTSPRLAVGPGDNSNTQRVTPVQVGIDTKWASVAAGGDHTVAVTTDGTLWAWGYNYYGQLGDGTTADRHAPVQVGTDTSWRSVAAGFYHTIGLRR